jgi:acyl carrier protein
MIRRRVTPGSAGGRMEHERLQTQIRDLIAHIIEVPPAEVHPDRHLVSDLGADPLNALEIVACLERQYGIVIDVASFQDLATLGSATRLVESLLRYKRDA